MSTAELLRNVQFLIDTKGNKKSVLLDYSAWEELLAYLEDLEDAQEIQQLREANEESITWDQAKTELRSEGIDVESPYPATGSQRPRRFASRLHQVGQ